MPTHSPARLRAGTAPTSADSAIDVTELIKTYGKGAKEVRALAGISFTVPAGGVFALLGPNGAGKSTTVKILTTLSEPDSGKASVAGMDVRERPARVRGAIGYVSQKPGFDPMSTGRENLVLQGRICGLSRPIARTRADELLSAFGLADAANRLASKWSGGMQRKLDVAMGLIHRPKVLFLDEPTTGLDPEARSEMWAEISRLATEDGLTVLLTTHYLEEADNLASRLVIIDRGRIVAQGSPEQLKSELSGDTVAVSLADPMLADSARQRLAGVPGVQAVEVVDAGLRASVSSGAAVVSRVLSELEGAQIDVTSVNVARPSLDDVYLRHAGRAFRTADEREGAAA